MSPTPPPGGNSSIEVAGVGRRFLGAIIDGLLVGIPLALATRAGLPGWATIIPAGVYNTALVAWRGQTLGMMAVSARVVTTKAATPSVPAALVRWVVFLGPNLIRVDSRGI